MPRKKSDIRIVQPKLKGKEWAKNPLKGTKRGFAIDGTHAFLRRRTANSLIAERTDNKARKGEYRHVGTFDDVEVYEISEDSPLRRKKQDLGELSIESIEKAIILAACKREWRLYYDAVSELAYRYKNSNLPGETSETILQTTMKYLHLRILRRGGPSDFEIANNLASIRKERTGRQIYMGRGH
jgi:hypothetical protein